MRLRPTNLLCSAFLLAISLANGLNAQTTTSGGLMGVVTDPSNAVVPDANVEIRDDAKGVIQETKTDREGVYRFFFLAPSRYALKVWRDRFREESRTVNVVLGPPVTVNVTLAVAKESTTVQESWAEHLRQHERLTRGDRDLGENVGRFESKPIKVRHFIYARSKRGRR